MCGVFHIASHNALPICPWFHSFSPCRPESLDLFFPASCRGSSKWLFTVYRIPTPVVCELLDVSGPVELLVLILHDHILHSSPPYLISLSICWRIGISCMGLSIAVSIVTIGYSSFWVVAHVLLVYNIAGKSELLKRFGAKDLISGTYFLSNVEELSHILDFIIRPKRILFGIRTSFAYRIYKLSPAENTYSLLSLSPSVPITHLSRMVSQTTSYLMRFVLILYCSSWNNKYYYLWFRRD